MSTPNAIPTSSTGGTLFGVRPMLNAFEDLLLIGSSLMGNASPMFLARVREPTTTYQVKTASSVFIGAAPIFRYFL
jgi:hypothetical protein